MGEPSRESSFEWRCYGSQKRQNKTKVDFGTCKSFNKEKRVRASRDNCLSGLQL